MAPSPAARDKVVFYKVHRHWGRRPPHLADVACVEQNHAPAAGEGATRNALMVGAASCRLAPCQTTWAAGARVGSSCRVGSRCRPACCPSPPGHLHPPPPKEKQKTQTFV